MKDEKMLECINFDKCGNHIPAQKRGRKSKRCKICQIEFSKKLRRDAYRKKVQDVVKMADCEYRGRNGQVCGMKIPYVTNKPKHCPKHSRKVRLDWMRQYYTGEKIVPCECCGRPMRYETKKPDKCFLCRAKERLEIKRSILYNKQN